MIIERNVELMCRSIINNDDFIVEITIYSKKNINSYELHNSAIHSAINSFEFWSVRKQIGFKKKSHKKAFSPRHKAT
ncbi:CLUMA_CG018404, isoform A [Clunio marinus]|uniref:CLUMA_CG018404, isoform A n=1 Tax=Clunio marinus TaxID=568069 RepID=A0A1J1IYN3_9DIPT|nr:CLUMA_CG018404, isoform A [Clunio marinus]